MTTLTSTKTGSGELQFASFQIGDLLLGVDIHQVREINRNLQIAPVPHTPETVRGVINLRGEVVTVIDLRRVLGLPPAEFTRATRNVIVNSGGERIGLLVDAVADVITCEADDIDTLPENLSDVEQRLFAGVFKLEQGLLVVLKVEETLSSILAPQAD
jgi:purine-binding chemotaxis protein CheW